MSALLLTALLVSQAPSYDAPGPFTIGSSLDQTLPLPSGDVDADLYWAPARSSLSPIVVIGHGFARNKGAMTNWGEHLASHGFVAVVLSFPRPLVPNHADNALRMREAIAYVRANPGQIGGGIDPTKSALVGHSAGGLSAFLAAADDPTITTIVGLDPVDAQMMGTARAGAITQPTLVLGATPSMCNASGSSSSLYGALVSNGSWFLRVNDSTHCDGEDPSDNTCNTLCGAGDAARRALYRKYATAHLLWWTGCTAPELLSGGTGLAADLAAGTVSEFDEVSGITCNVTVGDAGVSDDSGVIEDDAGGSPPAPRDAEPADVAVEDGGTASDATVEADAASEEDAAVEPTDAGVLADAGSTQPPPLDEAEESCGCRATNNRSSAIFGLVLLALIFRTGRRRS